MIKSRIKILNIGPIKEVDFSLNKINIFIGEQSSGKSTIAKIVSFCQWVEKDISVRQSFESYRNEKEYFIDKLTSFHKLETFFSSKSELLYESDIIKIHYKNEILKLNWKERYNYKRLKISYIPSERSVAVLPEMEKVELPNNYIKSFLFDWFDARKSFSEEEKLSLLNLNANYYFTESNKESHITDKENSYNISLSNASSGLQSATPLVVMIEYLTKHIYLKEQNSSYELDNTLLNTSLQLFKELVVKKYNSKFSKKLTVKGILNKLVNNKDKELVELFINYNSIKDNLSKTSFTSLIIEEPEQNLFPSTQKSLIYYLLEEINKSDHLLTLTTHSPYVLYAFNNCILASIVDDKLSDNERNRLSCLKSKINPNFISIYQIKEGKINNIQKEDGLINDNFFDTQMKSIMDEFYIMLNHY